MKEQDTELTEIIHTDLITNHTKNCNFNTTLNDHKIKQTAPQFTKNNLKQSTHTTKMSLTEQQMNSHPTVKQILNNCRNKVVCHRVNTVSSDLQLYKTYRKRCSTIDVPSFQITGKQDMHKVIFEQIVNDTPIRLKIKQTALNKNINKAKISINPISLPSKRNSSIALSGLTTYNFTSIKSRYRLAYNPEGTEQQFNNSIQNAHRQAHKSIARSQLIKRRTNSVSADQTQQINDAIIQNYIQLNTDEYLQALQKQKNKNSYIYGDKEKYIRCIERTMIQQGVGQDQAEFMIGQIKMAARNNVKNKLMVKYRRNLIFKKSQQEDQVFQCRKQPSKSSKAVISNILNQ